MMGGFDGFGAGAMGLGATWMVLFWVLVIGGAALLLRGLISSNPAGRTEGREQTPLEILGQRYAKGEIQQEEFEQKKRDLTK